MIVPNQRNIKVHFAGCERFDFAHAAGLGGVRYCLYTAYSFLAKKFGVKAYSFDFKDGIDPIKEINRLPVKHMIQDSGLFSLMFGNGKEGNYDRKFLEKWNEALCDFVLENKIRATCVEVDCQKILGVEEAWRFRQRMRERLPGNRIINVFHIEDGRRGLDRLIEYSDYMAISIPELRLHFGIKEMKEETVKIATYIKNKKPSIDIHLLGCTELELLRRCKFCTSSDSTAWLGINRFGNYKKFYRAQLRDEWKARYRAAVSEIVRKYTKESEKVIDYLSNYATMAHYLWNKYQKICGDQS